MANPLLRRYAVAPATVAAANTQYTALTVAAPRALAISKITVVPTAALTFRLWVGGEYIAYDVALTVGETFTESGLVVLATETVTIQSSVIGGLTLQVFGEEVDNN